MSSRLSIRRVAHRNSQTNAFVDAQDRLGTVKPEFERVKAKTRHGCCRDCARNAARAQEESFTFGSVISQRFISVRLGTENCRFWIVEYRGREDLREIGTRHNDLESARDSQEILDNSRIRRSGETALQQESRCVQLRRDLVGTVSSWAFTVGS